MFHRALFEFFPHPSRCGLFSYSWSFLFGLLNHNHVAIMGNIVRMCWLLHFWDTVHWNTSVNFRSTSLKMIFCHWIQLFIWPWKSENTVRNHVVLWFKQQLYYTQVHQPLRLQLRLQLHLQLHLQLPQHLQPQLQQLQQSQQQLHTYVRSPIWIFNLFLILIFRELHLKSSTTQWITTARSNHSWM